MTAAQEEVYNTHLSLLLAAEGMDVKPEARQPGRKRVDVLASVKGVRVAVEAKISNRTGALAAAHSRLEQGLVDAAVAVSYPEMSDPSKLRTLDAAAAGDRWRTVDIPQLARLIAEEAGSAGDIDATLAKFRAGLEQAADRITDDQAMGAVRVANIPQPSKEDIRKKPAAQKHPRLRLALLVASAALFHANLDGLKLRRPHKDARNGTIYQGGWPPQKLRDCLDRSDITDGLIDAWETILALDYKPVFEAAVNVLRSLPPGPETAGFAKTAAGAGLRAAGSLAGQRHDLLGRVFHWILSTASPTGAFYTSEAAATLLAGLALRPQDADRFPDFTAVDPACGTGTLLMATAKQMGYLNKEAAGVSGGRDLIERVLRGYDIEAAAVQLAAVALGLMNPRVKFERMGIHHLTYGTDPAGSGLAGSLELYGKSATANLLTPTSTQIDTGTEVLTAERHDLVIMNPPFTRSALRHDHLGVSVEKAVKAREAELFRDAPVFREGGSGMFLLLGDQLCDEETGTMAAVLPTSQFNRSKQAQAVWEHLLKSFHLETVVTSHDPRRYWFSENTPVSESLFVLRRLNDDNRNLPTRFINLAHNPAKVSGAAEAAEAINSGDVEMVEWPRSRVEARDWTPVKFLSSYLTHTVTEWFSDQRLNCVPLGQLSDVGPTEVRVRETYTRGSLSRPDEHGRVGIWYNNQDKPAKNGAPPKWSMSVSPDCSLHRREDIPGGRAWGRLADDYWERKGRLFLSLKFRTGSARTFVVRTTEPALGAGWVPAKHLTLTDPEDWEKAMCVYLNSTVGVLAQTWASSPKVFGRPDMKLVGLRSIPVPDFTGIQTARLARVFEEFSHRHLLRYQHADSDPVRQRLDLAICDVVGWKPEDVATARCALAREPSVTGQPAD